LSAQQVTLNAYERVKSLVSHGGELEKVRGEVAVDLPAVDPSNGDFVFCAHVVP
jgi:hypothetical protein